MPDRTTRLALTVLAVALPGPWTPVIVLGYALARRPDPSATADTAHAHPWQSPPSTLTTPAVEKPDPYAPARSRR